MLIYISELCNFLARCSVENKRAALHKAGPLLGLAAVWGWSNLETVYGHCQEQFMQNSSDLFFLLYRVEVQLNQSSHFSVININGWAHFNHLNQSSYDNKFCFEFHCQGESSRPI